jgi:hypothetical protein
MKPRRKIARNTKPIPRKTRPKVLRTTLRAITRRVALAAWAVAVKERAEMRCELRTTAGAICEGQLALLPPCGGRLESHHHYRKGPHPRLELDPDNGIALCKTHHDWTDTPEGRLFMPLWLESKDPERWRRLTEKAQRESRLS